MSQCILVYDIPDDGKRTKIADVCLDYGLDRIQYSAFVGKLLPTGKRSGNIQLVAVHAEDWANRKIIVQEE